MPDIAPKIILIRHAEKPDDAHAGVSERGEPCEKDLSVRGWQRGGALVCLLAPPGGQFQDRRWATPHHLFASHSSSNRPRQTLIPLAEKLGVEINSDYGKGDEMALAAAAKACTGVVLISWQHEYMAAVANAILGDNHTAPQNWPSRRFDVAWIFDRKAASTYRFQQVPQLLLAGDSASVI